MKKIRTAVIQLNSGSNKFRNIENATELIVLAASEQARLICLPEAFNWRGRKKDISYNAEPIPGLTSKKMSDLARSLKVYLLCGTILETNSESTKPFNTSFLLNPDGEIAGCYRKIHLFKLRLVNHTSIDENKTYSPGDTAVITSTTFAEVGFSICYDLRFPELYRSLVRQGAEVIFVPSAFTLETGTAHWEILLRARAIENQVYIVAPNQCGTDPLGTAHYGHSMIIDPWGHIIAQGSDRNEIIYADLDPACLKQVRERLPSLEHMQQEIF
jgi:predicted amidohydrolase